MLYKISKLIANKKKYVINVVISLFVLIAIAISVIGSYSLFQYQSMNENFQNNEFAKTITTICYYDKHTHNQRALDNNDLVIIKDLFKNEDYTIFADYEIHFGLSSDNGDGFFIKTFTDNLLVGDIKDYQLVTNTKFNYETITLNIPIVNEEEGGFSSNALVQKDFTIKTVDESSPLNKYIGRNIAIVSYNTFKEIAETMFENKEYKDIESIYINIEDIGKIKEISKILEDNNYENTHAFQYYSNLDSDVNSMVSLSLIILLILLIFAICFLIGIFEIMLKNSVGDIATLKHYGYELTRIRKIYLLPIIVKIFYALVFIFICNTLLYFLNIIKNFNHIFFFEIVLILICLFVFVVMFIRVSYYSKLSILELTKRYKVEE